jgi:hypothetical protein
MSFPQLRRIDNLNASIRGGEAFLMKSFNGDGWGYVPDSPTELYPTLLALWALGETGHRYGSSWVVERAIEYVDSMTELKPKELALKLIAFKSVGYPPNETEVETCKELLSNPELGMDERAYLTYALVLYEPFSFDTAKALMYIETAGSHNGTFYLTSRPGPLLYTDTITPTAYSVMAFARVSDSIMEVSNPRTELCHALTDSQNLDGGWGIYPGRVSDPKATYYAVRAVSRCTSTSENVERAIKWAKEHLEAERQASLMAGTVTRDYYYTVKILKYFK